MIETPPWFCTVNHQKESCKSCTIETTTFITKAFWIGTVFLSLSFFSYFLLDIDVSANVILWLLTREHKLERLSLQLPTTWLQRILESVRLQQVCVGFWGTRVAGKLKCASNGFFPQMQEFHPNCSRWPSFSVGFFLFLFGVYDISGPNHFRKCDKSNAPVLCVCWTVAPCPCPSQAENGRKNLPVSVKLRKKPISLPVELQSWPFSVTIYVYICICIYIYIHMYRYFHLNKQWNHGQLDFIHSSKRHCLFSSSCSSCIAWDIPHFAWEDHKWVKIEDIWLYLYDWRYKFG